MARIKPKTLLLAMSVAVLGSTIATAQAAPDWYQPDSTGEVGQGSNQQGQGSSTPIVVVQGGTSRYLIGSDSCTDDSIGTVILRDDDTYGYCTGKNTSKKLPDGGIQYDNAVSGKLSSINAKLSSKLSEIDSRISSNSQKIAQNSSRISSNSSRISSNSSKISSNSSKISSNSSKISSNSSSISSNNSSISSNRTHISQNSSAASDFSSKFYSLRTKITSIENDIGNSDIGGRYNVVMGNGCTGDDRGSVATRCRMWVNIN